MADCVQEQLLGYLLGALEDSERESIEEQLRDNPKLLRELASARENLLPLWVTQPDFVPPSGLVMRTCRYVASHSEPRAKPAPARPAPAVSADVATGKRAATPALQADPTSIAAASGNPVGYWSWLDLAVVVGIVMAVSLLIFPAIQSSRFNARLAACQDNLRELGLALTQYSEKHEDYFPQVRDRGRLAGAGIYAPVLLYDGFLNDPRRVVCPGSPLAEDGQFHVPSLDELLAAVGEERDRLHGSMGGSYGYVLGYVEDGRYRSTRNMRRPYFALMADVPSTDLPCYQSVNHSGRGQNVLFEDGRVTFLSMPKPHERADDLFVNESGMVAAGNHQDDSVIASSASVPLIFVKSP